MTAKAADKPFTVEEAEEWESCFLLEAKGHAFRTYDWDCATGMVDRVLAGYDLPGERS